MIRKIIKIDGEKCDGCGACAEACHEGAIQIHNGKAKLIRDDYCDGLGDCLPSCHTGAISFEEREAQAYDEIAVKKNLMDMKKSVVYPDTVCNTFEENSNSELNQWPVQIKLIPVNAPYFNGANLLIAADCTAFAYGRFHQEFIKNHVTLIGCSKLDNTDYSDKLAEILKRNEIQSIKIVRMEVPCCGGLENAVKKAVEKSGKAIPTKTVVVGTDGSIRNT